MTWSFWLDHFLDSKAEFCLIFRSFFGQWSFKKNAFEIYWPLWKLQLRNLREKVNSVILLQQAWRAILNCRSHNYGILQIQKFENLVKSLKYHIILGGFSSWQLRDLTRFFNFWISKIAVKYDFFFRKWTVFVKNWIFFYVMTSKHQIFKYSLLYFFRHFFLVWIFFPWIQ